MDRVLIIDDERRIRMILRRLLRDEGYDVEDAASGERGIEVAREFRPDVVLMDLSLPGMDGIEAMATIREFVPETETIMMTAYGTIESAVEAMRKGAYDYLTKPFDNDALVLKIKRLLERKHLSREVETLKDQLNQRYAFENIVAVSGAMQAVFEMVRRASKTDVTVLVEGESGTGKELIVRALHHHSRRKDKPFVPVNCAALPTHLIENELFGHEKGAFTDATERYIGKFEQASGGTLFLDEIVELPSEAQAKLLRAVQEREITRIGGTKTIPVDVRMVAATNQDMETSIEEGRLRRDLYYRLNVVSIKIPPLRERKEDIPLLVDHFIARFAGEIERPLSGVSEEAIRLLNAYDWPGNVRELENVLQGAMVMAKDDFLRTEDLPLRIQTVEADRGEFRGTLAEVVAQVERRLIGEALRIEGSNRTRTAKRLGITRKTLLNKIEGYGLESSSRRTGDR